MNSTDYLLGCFSFQVEWLDAHTTLDIVFPEHSFGRPFADNASKLHVRLHWKKELWETPAPELVAHSLRFRCTTLRSRSAGLPERSPPILNLLNSTLLKFLTHPSGSCMINFYRESFKGVAPPFASRERVQYRTIGLISYAQRYLTGPNRSPPHARPTRIKGSTRRRFIASEP